MQQTRSFSILEILEASLTQPQGSPRHLTLHHPQLQNHHLRLQDMDRAQQICKDVKKKHLQYFFKPIGPEIREVNNREMHEELLEQTGLAK